MKLWTPSDEYVKSAELTHYAQFLNQSKNLSFDHYSDLWKWSVDHLDDFWESILNYFEVEYSGAYSKVLDQPNEEHFMGTRWFQGIELNYAEHIFRHADKNQPAIIYRNESGEEEVISWKELKQQVNALRQYFIRTGLQKGDTVAGVLNHTPQTVALFLAVNSIGAIWSCCSPEFGTESILERFELIKPKILLADKEYIYKGKLYSKRDLIKELTDKLDSIEDVIVVNDLKWRSILAIGNPNIPLVFERVPFSHPIWILFSSGTTGKPKAIVHSTGGNLLEHLKVLALHQNVHSDDRFLWYSTTGWMMWNYSIGSLLLGCTLCIFEGSLHDPTKIVDFAQQKRVNHFGAGAPFFTQFIKGNYNVNPSMVKTIGSTGSPLPAETFIGLQKQFPNVPIISLSGGTDVCSAFLSGCAWLPIHAGEIQCKALGAAVDVAQPDNEIGELIIRKPMPSMPIYFWGDEQNQVYFKSYFKERPGVWSHGDWIKINPDTGGILMFGRSDATLNRDGVRIGTAEIYNGIADITEIDDSVVVCLERTDGSSTLQLFVKLVEGEILTPTLINRIKQDLKSKYSPRHVPDVIEQVPDIPYTLNGKKLELPIKKILLGFPLEKAVAIEAVKNPESLNYWLLKKS